MDLEIIKLSKVKSDIGYHLYMEYKSLMYINLFTEQKQTHRFQKTNLCLPKGKDRGGYIRRLELIYTHYYR